ncbi:putative glycoside hydrolase family 3 protein [Eutypa lata UCREL1]|uniref:Putative glycoside hydrolase family 3 protein n=1 Tax=Eutypa lata (strain UCR-EL1) TaxID=1287681 RepID=M7TJ71_EUTLA|nr:putative glycoside hydrolase family 3 protein [Eutypa lata UCREL1]
MSKKMAKTDVESDPLWQDINWAIGQMVIMGWDGTEVTPQIRNLIEHHHLGSIILTAKNLKSAQQTANLVQELQLIAHQAGHPVPLLIAVDQENGGVNSLFDEDYICQFPSAMGIAATGSPELAYSVAKATATEVSAVGVNLILGPVLDVLTNARHQPLGVRAVGDDPQEASQYAIASLNGYKDAGLATCGKHFPSYGNLDFLGSSLDMPIITQTLEELSLSALVPFRNAIASGRLDGMFVGGCGIQNAGMNVMHACLSDQVVDDLLRGDLGFNGVSISECLEMQSLIQEYGVKGGTVMAVEAGNDLILLCRAHDVQLEAISGLKLGIENGIITKERVYTSLKRVLRMKSTGFTKHVAMMCHMLRASGQKKSLIVVSVSSPYDFAMDKSIGTYVCTFDFTETAMSCLVRALNGDFIPQGSMPGTMRKSKKVSKTRQQWLVEDYNRDRDARGLDELLKTLSRSSTPSLPYLTTTSHSFELFNPNIEESHYVVRNSSTQALYGFVATYTTQGVGAIGAIFVDPAKRNVSIGRSLHRRAMRALLQKQGVNTLQLGLTFPGIFPGVPGDETKSWFAKVGWDIQFPRRLTNLSIEELGTWAAPEGLLPSIQRANISFDLIHGLDNAESVLNHVAASGGPEVVELYKYALQEVKACGVVRAKNPNDILLGTVIICVAGSHLSTFIPSLQTSAGADVGGIIAPIVSPSPQSTLVLQGLAYMGVRQNKAHKAAKSVLSWIPDDAVDPLAAMGFEVQQAFDEITNSPEHWSDLI